MPDPLKADIRFFTSDFVPPICIYSGSRENLRQMRFDMVRMPAIPRGKKARSGEMRWVARKKDFAGVVARV